MVPETPSTVSHSSVGTRSTASQAVTACEQSSQPWSHATQSDELPCTTSCCSTATLLNDCGLGAEDRRQRKRPQPPSAPTHP